MNSNTGTAQTYEAGDQRNEKSSAPGRYESGKPNAHYISDPKDSRSLANRAAAEQKEEREEELTDATQARYQADPTAPAKDHGNRPSRGAEIDAELQKDDELRLQEKGQA